MGKELEYKRNIEIIKEQAELELKEENNKKAKTAIKEKLVSLNKAKQIVKNIERELEDLYIEIEQGNL